MEKRETEKNEKKEMKEKKISRRGRGGRGEKGAGEGEKENMIMIGRKMNRYKEQKGREEEHCEMV
jgi:hypothetical protein